MTSFHIEDIMGATVRDANGRDIGHVYEIVVEEHDGELVIVEYHLGSGAVFERISTSLRNMFGLKQKEPVRIHWDRLDLSNPKNPVVTTAPGSRG